MKNKGISRKTFLGQAAAGLGLLALNGAGCFSSNSSANHINFRMLGPDHSFGHQIRKSQSLQANRKLATDVLIVGGGIAGLACAWQLQKKGFQNFLLVELESELGGNSRAGKMAGIAHPLGAHYLPLPDTSNKLLLDFLEDVGVLKGYDALNRPIYDEIHLCHTPQERLQIHGKWQKGLLPHLGVPNQEIAQIKAFSSKIEAYKLQIGNDGKPAFCIPAAASSNDPEFIALDQLTMKAWLLENGWDSPHLNWYIDYCCRDDYGMEAKDCSAWAGIHYFASRKGSAANAEENSVLTWPEGNAWLARKLKANLADNQVFCETMVMQLEENENGVKAVAVEKKNPNSALEINAKTVVFAGPQFVAARLFPSRSQIVQNLSYAPWLVANILVRREENTLLEDVHWDNVCYGRKSLGYVHAAHQMLQQNPNSDTVLTWYQPLSEMSPHVARKQLLENRPEYWRDFILADMEYAHPGITKYISAIDAWPWGHAMVRPVPGLVKGEMLKTLRQPEGNVFFANSDLSGLSIFEEAFHYGTLAANDALQICS